jgi:hypothetical protein
MALNKTMTVPVTIIKAALFGVLSEEQSTATVPDVYIKVERVSGSKESATAEVSFKAEGFSGAKSYPFEPTMDGSNFISQAYAHLKTLPEFADAEDC